MMPSISTHCNYTDGHSNGTRRSYLLILLSYTSPFNCEGDAYIMHIFAPKYGHGYSIFLRHPSGGDGCSWPMNASVKGCYWARHTHWCVAIDCAAVGSCPLCRSQSRLLFVIVIVSIYRRVSVVGETAHRDAHKNALAIIYDSLRRSNMCKVVKGRVQRR